MAKSKAKKMRAHAERNGRRNPEQNRIQSPDFSTHVRKNPTLKERRERQDRKHRQKLCLI